MRIFNYLAKEICITITGLTGILLLIFMSNQMIIYLNRAASGKIPIMFILKLLLLEMPNLLSLLLPLGLYVAILLVYGRLYAESEMVVLKSSGYSSLKLLRDTFIITLPFAILVAFMMFFLTPKIAVKRANILRDTGLQVLLQTIIPGQFRTIPPGDTVFYVSSMNNKRDKAHDIFLAQFKNNKWDLLLAKKALLLSAHKEHLLTLQNANLYQGIPGKSDYRVSTFRNYIMRLPHTVIDIKDDIRIMSTKELLHNMHDPKKSAELQWRLSVPIMIFILAFIAVPLSKINPRSGKFSKILPAIVIYIIYANFMFIARNWITIGKTPVWLGYWWLHAIAILLGIGIFVYQERKHF